MRKTLLMAATVLAAGAGVALIGQAQAAPAKDPMCGMAAQANAASWQEYYHCWGTPPRERVAAHPAKGPAKDPMCGMASQASSLSWQERYNCFGSAAPIKVAAPKPPANPYCGMAAQSGSQSWAAYYHCW